MLSSEQRLQRNESFEKASQETMSYSYGPTVVYPPATFSMGEPFSNSFEHKENYSFGMNVGLSKVSSQNSRQAFSNLSNAGCYASAPQESFSVFDDSCSGAREHKVASTSGRVPFADRQNTTTTQSTHHKPQPAAKPAKRQSWTDIDEQNKDNPLACHEYAAEIFQYLGTAELLNRANPKYLETVQRDTTPHMRCILVDWLVEVAQEYRLTSDTLHLTINMLDRFLSLQPVAREELQLAGIACMWAASKFEEIYAPTARNFCYITDNTYDYEQLVAMEGMVLAVLEFQLSVPTAKTFQRRYLQAAAADEHLHYLAAFLLELTLMDEAMITYLPSQLAAASVYLSQAMLGCKPWDATLAHYTGYRECEVQPIARELAFLHAKIISEGSFQAIREKYSSEKLLSVANIPSCQKILQQHERAAELFAQPGSPADGSSDMDMDV